MIKSSFRLQSFGVNISPATWASRIARCHTIGNVRTSVHICTELFGTFLMEGDWEPGNKDQQNKDEKPDTKKDEK